MFSRVATVGQFSLDEIEQKKKSEMGFLKWAWEGEVVDSDDGEKRFRAAGLELNGLWWGVGAPL